MSRSVFGLSKMAGDRELGLEKPHRYLIKSSKVWRTVTWAVFLRASVQVVFLSARIPRLWYSRGVRRIVHRFLRLSCP